MSDNAETPRPMYMKIRDMLIPLLYIVVMGWTVWDNNKRPFYNWDMLCYIGSAVAFEEKDPQQIYNKTMAMAKENIPGWVYEQHATNMLSSEYTAFNDIVPLCQIKPLYTGAMWLLHQTGMSLPQASWTISNTCFLILAAILFLWRPQFMHRDVWLLLVLVISFCWEMPMRTLGQLSTPDSIGTMLTIGAFYAWLQKRSYLWFAVLGILATIARPDAMIIMGAATAYFAVLAPEEYRSKRIAAAAMMGALLISYVAFKHAFAAYTFDQYFIHSLVSLSAHPNQITQKVTPELYWWIFTGSLAMFFSYSRVITLAVFALVGLACYFFLPHPSRRIWRDVLLITLVSWATRFIMWPSWGDYRFYYSYTVLLILTAGELVWPVISLLLKSAAEQRKKIKEGAQ